MTVKGLKLYFIGFLFAGINIVGTGYLSATEQAGWAFAAAELITLFITELAFKRTK